MKKLSLDEAHYLSAAVLPYGLEVLQEYTETVFGACSARFCILFHAKQTNNNKQTLNGKTFVL